MVHSELFRPRGLVVALLLLAFALLLWAPGSASASIVSAGGSHACGIDSSGGVKCWGSGQFGKLGNGASADSAVPMQVSGLTSGVTDIDSGYNNTCSVVAGVVKCWGAGDNGMLGGPGQSNTPLDITGLGSAVTEVSIGGQSVCALDGGAVKCWGRQDYGELGNDEAGTNTHTTPVGAIGLDANVTALDAGGNHVCAVRDGAAWCWGLNHQGQVGDGTITPPNASRYKPVLVQGLPDGDVTAISAGTSYACAVVDGGVWCWGGGTATPAAVPGLSGVTAIAAGANHTCALASGVVKCWGANTYGQLGNGTVTASSTPVSVVGAPIGIVDLSAGESFTCAASSSTVKCWGANGNGQLGFGEEGSPTTAKQLPVPPGFLANVTSIAAGSFSGCFIYNNGMMAARCWGYNDNGQIGDGTSVNAGTPQQVSGLTDQVSAVTSGDRHSCAIQNGAAKCWGNNNFGRLGDGTQVWSIVPKPVSSMSADVASISAGKGHTCAVKVDAAYCWGVNTDGQLGDASNTNRFAPEAVNGLALGSGASDIAAGGAHTCAIVSGGATKCWGKNDYGQLGNGSYSTFNVPQQVSGLTTGASAIAAGSTHTCAVVSGGAKCWGNNDYGQLGAGFWNGASNVPVQVSGMTAGSGVTAIAVGDRHTCAVQSGTAKCWGANTSGQLGDGTQNHSNTPVTVLGLPGTESRVAASYATSCVMSSVMGAGVRAFCWGSGALGQTGTGDAWRPTPVTVSALTPLDVTAPNVAINAPTDGAVIAATSVEIEFTASDDVALDDCNIDSGDNLPLASEGVNTLVVSCDDTTGNTGTASVDVTRDTTGPTITFNAPTAGAVLASNSATVDYGAVDATGVASCDRATGSTVTLVAGTNTITVSCTDTLGNVGSASVQVTYAPPTPALPAITKAPSRSKPGKTITLTLSCPAGCTITPRLTIGKKRVKGFKAVTVPAGTTSVKVKFPRSATKRVKRALKQNKRTKVLLRLVPSSAAGTGAAKTVRIR